MEAQLISDSAPREQKRDSFRRWREKSSRRLKDAVRTVPDGLVEHVSTVTGSQRRVYLLRQVARTLNDTIVTFLG